MALVTVLETWELNNAVCLPKRGMTSVVVSPLPVGCIVTNSTLFVVFSEPVSGEVNLQGVIDESRLVQNSPPSLENALSSLRNIGITHVSGFNDLSVSFDKASPSKEENSQSSIALIPDTHNTFFAKLLTTSLGDTLPPTECVQYVVYSKLAGQTYTTAPLTPLTIAGSSVLVTSWETIGSCDVVSLPDTSSVTTLECYPRGSEISLPTNSLTPGANYYWVDDSFALVSEPLPVTTTKTFFVGVALTANTLNLTLSLLFEA